MSQTLQIINMIVLVIVIGFALYSLSKSDRERKKKKAQDEDYRTVVNDFTGLGKEYDPHKWYFKMPDSALKYLEV